MTVVSKLFEGTIEAEIGIKISQPYSEWRSLGPVQLPYKVRLYLQPPVEEASDQ